MSIARLLSSEPWSSNSCQVYSGEGADNVIQSAEIVSPRSASGPAIILPAGVADTWSRIIREESNMRRGNEMLAVLIQFAGTSTGAPLSLTRNTTNFAGLVWLAFRPTT